MPKQVMDQDEVLKVMSTIGKDYEMVAKLCKSHEHLRALLTSVDGHVSDAFESVRKANDRMRGFNP